MAVPLSESERMTPITLIVTIMCLIVVNRAPFPLYWAALALGLMRIAWQLCTLADEATRKMHDDEENGHGG